MKKIAWVLVVVLLLNFLGPGACLALQPSKLDSRIVDGKLYINGKQEFLKIASILTGFSTQSTDSIIAALPKYKDEKQYNAIQLTLYWQLFDPNWDGVVNENGLTMTNLKRLIAAIKENGLYLILGTETYSVGGSRLGDTLFTQYPDFQAKKYDGSLAYDVCYSPSNPPAIPSIFSPDYLRLSRNYIKDIFSKIDNSSVVWYETQVESQFLICDETLDYSKYAVDKYKLVSGEASAPAPTTQKWRDFKARELAKWVDGDIKAIKDIFPYSLVATDFAKDDQESRSYGMQGNPALFLENLNSVDIIQINWHYGYSCGDAPCEFAYDLVRPLLPTKKWGLMEHMTINPDFVVMNVEHLLNRSIERGNKVGWGVINASPKTSDTFATYNDDFSPKGNLAILDNNFISRWKPIVVPSSAPSIASPVNGDANLDGVTNLSDFVTWKREFVGAIDSRSADFNRDGLVNLADFVVWKKHL